MQQGLKDARKTALGADAVVGVDLDYSEISGGKSMLFLVASGTAVKLAPSEADQIG